MNRFVLATTLAVGALSAPATLAQSVVYQHPLDYNGNLHKSSWYAPDGLDDDIYTWDAFTLPVDQAITEIRWMGGYYNFLAGAGKAPVYEFTVAIWPSIPGGFQPDILAGPLVEWEVGSNAGETPSGISIPVHVQGIPDGMSPLYNYAFVLPKAFQAAAGTKYWVQIEGWQALTPQYFWPPDWSLPGGSGGDGAHFRHINDGPYQNMPHDLTFTVLGPAACYADCDGSGALDVDDFICFQTLFGMGDLGADCDASGALDIDDFICFQTAFGVGCG